ncbi:MAG: nitroreductase family protein [bacterium]|jgi:nitroreductase|nr:nitroreductase family protein [bacterium]
MDALFTRRSIRKYTTDPIAPETIRYLLKAAMCAPNALGNRPWHFIIIDDRQILDRVPEVHPYAKMVPQAPVAVVVCGDMSFERSEAWWYQDCSAATENLLLAVAQRELGAVWLGVYPREDRVNGLKRLLNLPDNIVPFSLIPIGHPAEEKEPNDIFEEDKVHYNIW